MRRENLEDLELNLARLKIRENQVREEMELLRKSVDEEKRKGWQMHIKDRDYGGGAL